jgi:hypothetical protein
MLEFPSNPVISMKKIDLSSLKQLHYLGAILYLVNRVSDTAFPHDINKCHKGTLTCPLYLGVVSSTRHHERGSNSQLQW